MALKPIPRTTGPLKGLHEDENPFYLEQGELVRAENIERRGETVGTRSGTRIDDSDYDAQIADGPEIQGIYERRVNFDEGRQLLAIAKRAASANALWTSDTTAIDLTTPSITVSSATTVANNTRCFSEHQNIIYVAGGLRGAAGASAGNDDFFHYNGTAATKLTITNGADDGARGLRPTHVFSWRGYLLINGLRQTTQSASDNPACTRYCDFGTDPTTAANWNSGNTLGFSATRPGVDSFGPTFTTGFGSYTDGEGQWLLVLTNKALFSYALDIAEDFVFFDSVSNGCVHQNAFVSLGVDSGDAVYASSFGIHSLRQSQQYGGRSNAFLSWKIRNTWAQVNKNRLQAIVGAYDQLNGRVIFAVPTGSSVIPDRLLVLDIKDQPELTSKTARWYVWRTQGFSITSLFYGRTSVNNPRLYFGTSDGRIGFFDSDTFQDMGAVGGSATDYPCTLQTRHDSEGVLQLEKQMGDVYVAVTGRATGDYNINYRTIFDFGRSNANIRDLRIVTGSSLTLPVTLPATLGGDLLPRASRVYATGSGQTISHEISASSSSAFYVSSIDYNVMVSGEGFVDEAA